MSRSGLVVVAAILAGVLVVVGPDLGDWPRRVDELAHTDGTVVSPDRHPGRISRLGDFVDPRPSEPREAGVDGVQKGERWLRRLHFDMGLRAFGPPTGHEYPGRKPLQKYVRIDSDFVGRGRVKSVEDDPTRLREWHFKPCEEGGIRDCVGGCVDQDLVGDGYCHEELACAELLNDGRDCREPLCRDDQVPSCPPSRLFPTNRVQCVSASRLGNGICDRVLMCPAHDFDGGDCPTIEDCEDGEIRGCHFSRSPDMSCFSATLLNDARCDAALQCAQYRWDGGDCPSHRPLEKVEDPAQERRRMNRGVPSFGDPAVYPPYRPGELWSGPEGARAGGD